MCMKNKLKSYFPYIILILSAVILSVRAFYSFCWSDETLYSSTAYRFLSGDRLFADDWFPTQLSSVILVPLMSLYMALCGGTAGIIAFFRIIYVLVSLICSLTAYRILSEDKSPAAGFAAAVMMLFYVHLNIATMSYYAMSVQFFYISMLLIYHYLNIVPKAPKARRLLITAGIIFALSVLSLPTMAAAYIVIAAVMGVLIICRKQFSCENHIKEILIYTFWGIAAVALIFFIYLLCNVSVSDFIKGIPYVLSDEEHATSLIFPIRKMFISLNEVYHKAAYVWYLLVPVCLIFRKKLMNIKYLRLVFAFDVLLFIILAIYSFGHTGYIQSALCMFALPLYILNDNRDKRIFSLLYAGGMIFSLVYSYSSNGFLYVLSTGHAIAAVASIAIIFDFIRSIKDTLTGRIDDEGSEPNVLNARMRSSLSVIAISSACALVVFYALACTICLRIVNVYRDAPLNELTCRIEEGPAKGLITTPEHADSYDTVYELISKECTAESLGRSGNIFISKLLPWGYMCTDLRVAAHTCWRTNVNSERLFEFYSVNPDKLPDMVLILNEDIGSYKECGDVEADPIPNANEYGGLLEEYLENNDFDCKDTACGKLYITKER